MTNNDMIKKRQQNLEEKMDINQFKLSLDNNKKENKKEEKKCC